jgi:hypothetical protein
MGCGMNVNTLAIDVRLRNSLAQVGLEFPNPAILANADAYNFIESQLVTKYALR